MANEGSPAGWEALSHSARVRRAVEVGRQARGDASAAQLLLDWSSGGFTQRILAAFACYGSRNSAMLRSLTADASRSVARIAMLVLCHVGDDDSLLAALRDLPPQRVARVLLKLRRARPEIVDRCLADRLAKGDHAIWPLVPLGSAAVLDQHCATAAERGGTVFWHRLASLHPGRAATEVIARLNAIASPDGLLFAAGQTVLAVLSDRDPDAALQFVVALHRHLPLAAIPLQSLVVHRPVAVADLILAATDPASASFRRVIRQLDVARIVALHRRTPNSLGNPGVWLARLSAADRITIYRELAPGWTNADGLVCSTILRRLPAPLRDDEARRMAALPVLATRPLQRLPLLGLLPWDEARAAVQPWLTHPEEMHRAASLVALGEATRFDRGRLANLLELFTARKYEQDPVRMFFLDVLIRLPPGRWEVGHLPALAQIIRDALDASDLSTASVGALGRLVLSLLPFHPAWAAGQLAAVTRERGYPSWSGRTLTAEDVRRIAPALTPIVETWLNREDEGRVVALASSVGRWLVDWPELVGFLERLIRTGQDYSAATAVALVAKQVRAERERVITETLAEDESWILQPAVMNFLHTRRQDLLTPFLGQRAYSGRFSMGKVRHVLPLESGFFRWTDTQREIFAGSLGELAEPPFRPGDAQVTWDVLFAVRRLPALPGVGPERLIRLAHDPRAAVQETAVRALGRLDAREGIAELIEALGDSRARWAVYSLRQALNDLSPRRVLEVMRNVPLAKVTVAKEAVRLAGELGGSEALDWFGELDRLNLHRDVRGALLRALWNHLDRPEAWAILDASVTSPDPGVVIGLAWIQVDRASGAARVRVADLLRRLLDHPEPTVRIAVLARLTAQPVPDPNRELLAALLDKLASTIPDERSTGLAAALAGAMKDDAPAFAAAFTRLLPRRRELTAAVTSFTATIRAHGPRLLEIRVAVLAAIEADPSLIRLQIPLAAARFASEPFARWVLALVGTPRWHAPTQVAALDALCMPGQPAAELERVEAIWAASADPSARWLGLRLLHRVASSQGWTDERRARLIRYRADSSPIVADEATLTFPPDPSPSTSVPNAAKHG